MLWVHSICQLFSINHVAGRPPGDVYICCMWANNKRSNLAHVQDIPKICYSSCCAVVWYRDRGYLTNCYIFSAWWRHQMDIFSALLAVCTGNSPVTGEFPAKRPVTRSFDISFYLHLNKRLSKQWWGWWFETLSRPLWRHCNEIIVAVALLPLCRLICVNKWGLVDLAVSLSVIRWHWDNSGNKTIDQYYECTNNCCAN